MDEDIGVKAPVTRLRRRLSVEQTEENKSPTPGTPKKRGGRLASKPPLELIEENTPENSIKRSAKKGVAKELSDAVEDKPVTPSRRSTRIKSNTSIVSETVQNYDSPRAKRAARRISQLGSDNESVSTPVRQTRRTRKDSASSLDKHDTTLIKKLEHTNVIIEEDTYIEKLNNEPQIENNENLTIRKSPRLKQKKDKGRQSINNSYDEENEKTKTDSNTSKSYDKDVQKIYKPDNIDTQSFLDSTQSLIKDLNTGSGKRSSNLNKSMPVNPERNFINNRQRTKSFTSVIQVPDNCEIFFSDNETNKTKLQKKRKSNVSSFDSNIFSGSGDNNKPIVEQTEELETELKVLQEKPNLTLSSPTKGLNNSQYFITSPDDIKLNSDTDSVSKMLETSPSKVIVSQIFFEDTDSEGKCKLNKSQHDIEDQCVPVIETHVVLNKSNAPEANVSKINNSDIKTQHDSVNYNKSDIACVSVSCEPMDIDESLPITCVSDVEKSVSRDNNTLNSSSNKSKRKSSQSLPSSPLVERTENRSTLIISQIKDSSCTENSVTKSPTKETLSKSTSDIVHSRNNDKKRLSLDYSTSTPIQQKNHNKLGSKINSSVIDSTIKIEKKFEDTLNKPLKEISKESLFGNTSSNNLNEVESSNRPQVFDFIDDEANEASVDYVSGDSQDEDERQYEDENEIKEKGETLDSDDELSNDSDYEKNSFVVSSDEEDNELLSGSGDDLSMSDNELNMSKKSKKKFDERKIKEQKKASREMYESRHKLNKHEKSRSQIIESSDSENDQILHIRNRKRQRIESAQDDNLHNTSHNLSTKSKRKRIVSESSVSANDEREISAIGDVSVKCDPLSMHVKVEPKTPLKEMNLSTVQINENIERVDASGDISFSKTNQTKDPLEVDELSSMSENSEIVKNYDSMLIKLNTRDKKLQNTSLNINKKNKSKTHDSIIDRLNLTDTKNKTIHNKKSDTVNGAQHFDQSQISSNSKNCLSDNSQNDSSDSIDLQLLFSEDSSDAVSDKVATPKSSKESKEDFIPLKRTPGKVNILENTDSDHKNQEVYSLDSNSSKKKKHEKYFNNSEVNIGDAAFDNEEIEFIVDTKGCNDCSNSLDKSLDKSLTKKKNKRNISLNANNDIAHTDTDVVESNVLENQRNALSDNRLVLEKSKKSLDTNDPELQVSPISNTSDIKRKGSAFKGYEIVVTIDKITNDVKNCGSYDSCTEKKNEKKNKNGSDINFDTMPANNDMHIVIDTEGSKDRVMTLNVSLNSSTKKKKKSLAPSNNSDDDDAPLEIPFHSSKSTPNFTDMETKDPNSSIGSKKSKKKHKKNSVSFVENNEAEDVHSLIQKCTPTNKHSIVQEGKEETPAERLGKSKKQKIKSSFNADDYNIKRGENILPPKKTKNILNKELDTQETIIGKETTRVSREIRSKTQLENSKKRKLTDDDNKDHVSKVLKGNSFDQVHQVTRLPATVLNKLKDKPRKEVLQKKKNYVISTTNFAVEEAKIRKNKPSNFLEESVYLNESGVQHKQSKHLKKPKVLPFVPTAATSESGFTTNFKINVIPQEVKFVAQTNNMSNFKTDYFYSNKIKRLGTFEMYKKHRNNKISKF